MLAPTDRALAFPSGQIRQFALACGSCGLLLESLPPRIDCWEALAPALAAPRFVSDPKASFGLDIYTLRTAATRLHRGIEATESWQREALRHAHDGRAAAASLHDLAAHARPAVSLGIACRPRELKSVLAGMTVHLDWAAEVVVLLDAPVLPPTLRLPPGVSRRFRIAARPLNGDFAAQRNALQDLARTPWMLQLDADESLDPQVGRLVPALARLADDGDVVSVGLPRENHVDGVRADVFPDVQYRLNKRAVRYAGRVHERPDLGGDWRRSFIALSGAIVHHLTSDHVRARSRRYEALDPGRGRLEEEDGLLRPYCD